MRFLWGIVPDTDFIPSTAWARLGMGGSMWRRQFAALPVGVAATALLLAAWLHFAPPKIPQLLNWLSEILRAAVVGALHAAPWAAKGGFAVFAGWGLTAIVAVTLMLALVLPLAIYFLAHELVHALAGPSFGLTDASIVGVWPAGGVAYSYYDGEMSRERFMLVLLMPFLALSVLPLCLAVASGGNSPFLAALSLVNVVGSYVDLHNAGHIFLKVPSGAAVRMGNDGLWFRRT